MKLHTVVISFQRLELTKRAIASYLETVSLPFSLVVVDNGSDFKTTQWLQNEYDYGLLLLKKNEFPGFACNRGFDLLPPDATHLHRADNDFEFLPGWCEEVARCFKASDMGQVGLRTPTEEGRVKTNVGGNCVIRRELWDKGLRYDERPWPEYPPGWSEDSLLSPAVLALGYRWRRVNKPCIVPISVEDPADPYYQHSWGSRNIVFK